MRNNLGLTKTKLLNPMTLIALAEDPIFPGWEGRERTIFKGLPY